MTVTLKDIAEEANVTVMTVSNVINGRGKASQATVKKIMAIAVRMGYVPNAAARSLAARSSHIIGCLVRDDGSGNVLRDPYNAAIVGTLEPVVRQHGYHLLLQGISDPAAVPAAFQAWNLDGAIFIGFYDSALETMAPGLDKPLIALESYASHPGISTVRPDDHDGGYLATKHLIDNGHKHIAFAGPAAGEHGVLLERYAGYKAALSRAGMELDTSLVVSDTLSRKGPVNLGRNFKGLCPEATAIFATSDHVAIRIMEGLAEAGLRVPDDVSIVGFDNLDLATYATPKLTTVAQDLQRQATIAVEALLERIDHPGSANSETVLEVRLIERNSVKDIT